MPEQQDEVRFREGDCIVDARNDFVSRDEPYQLLRLDDIATNSYVDVGREPAHTACDDRNASDYHPRSSAFGQRRRQRRQRDLQRPLIANALSWQSS
jgi:hypothetical protein